MAEISPLQEIFINVTSCKGEISVADFLALDVQRQLYNFSFFHFWDTRPDDGCPVQPKRVAAYI